MIPNYLRDVEAARSDYAEAWAHAHVDGDPRRHEFIKLLARDLHAIDPHVALNGKRGDPDNLSMDAVNILCTAAESDGRTPDQRPCVVVDVIAHAGAKPPYSGSNSAPTAAWNVYKTRVEGSGAHVDPAVHAPDPPPPSSSSFPYPDEATAGSKFKDRVKAAYQAVGRTFPDPFDADAYFHFSRYGFSCHEMPETEAAAKHIAELRSALGAPPEPKD